MPVPIKERFRNVIQAAQGKEQKLVTLDMAGLFDGPEDDILNAKGTDGYWEMFRDPKVSSGVDGAITLMIPDVAVEAADDTPKGLRNASFVEAVIDAIPGSTLDVFRQMLRMAIVTGPSISEPQFEPVMLQGTYEDKPWGMAKGITAINVKNTQTFVDATNGIEIDRFGNILKFNQLTGYGHTSAFPSEVIYYAFRGSANNRWGTSLLHSVYDAWKYKRKILRIAAMFMATNASGIRTAKLPKDSTTKQLTDAQAVMRRLAEMQSFAYLDSWDVTIDKPGSGAGGHFLEFIQEMDRQILEGIYGDSAYSAQDQGSYASRLASQSNVQARMRAWGNGFMGAVSEQLAPWILRENGFDGPVPRIVATIPEDATSRVENYKALADMRQKGLLTIQVPDTAQRQIFTDMGVDVGEAETPEPQKMPEPVRVETEPDMDDEREEHETVAASEKIHAAAPKGRDAASIKRYAKELDEARQAGARDLSDTWQAIAPDILKKLEGKLFNPGLNGWKEKDLSKILSIVEETVIYKRSEMRKSFNSSLKTGYELGQKHAKAMMPIKAQERIQAAAGFTPAQVIKSLQNNSYLTLKKKYPAIADDVYRILENAVKGEVAPNVARIELQKYLVEGGVFRPGLAATIIDTSLGSAYNEARMSLFRKVEDATGRTPGGITGYVFNSQLKSTTTDICARLHGTAYKADDPAMPRPLLHYNCGSDLIPVFAGEEPWTPQSGGQFNDPADTAATVAKARADGQIQRGFGGN